MVCACYKYLKERMTMRQRGRCYSDGDASVGDSEVTLSSYCVHVICLLLAVYQCSNILRDIKVNVIIIIIIIIMISDKNIFTAGLNSLTNYRKKLYCKTLHKISWERAVGKIYTMKKVF